MILRLYRKNKLELCLQIDSNGEKMTAQKLKKLFSLINNSRGISIMEVLVASALMGGVALGVMQLSKNTTNMQREAGFSSAIMSMDSEIEKFLLNSDVCYATLSPLDFSQGTSIDGNATPPVVVDVPTIRFAQRDETTGALVPSSIHEVQKIHNSDGAPF